MKLSITDRNQLLNEVSREFVERRLQFALAKFGSKVREISVVLSDENGPRGGIDKACRIVVQLYRSRDVIITDQDDNAETCVARAADRVGRAVARAIERARTFQRFNTTE